MRSTWKSLAQQQYGHARIPEIPLSVIQRPLTRQSKGYSNRFFLINWSRSCRLKHWHPKLKTLPKVNRQKPCYRVLIGNEGIADIEVMRELPRDLRKWETAAGHSYPAFNIKPLYVYKRAGKEAKKTYDEFLKKVGKSVSGDREPVDTVSGWMQESEPAWRESDTERVMKCLNTLPNDLQESLAPAPPDSNELPPPFGSGGENCRDSQRLHPHPNPPQGA